MCGIGGFTRFNHLTGDEKTLQQMGEAMIHRGPDAGGVYLDEGVGLCHRRLAIIDLSDAGVQPMFSTDKQLVIAFNGEIYNFLSLREEMENDGYEFKSKTDTEVLLALYSKYGESMVDKIRGMFAFALWDKSTQSLFLARDRLGKKPLYYYHKDGYFIFASELKSILPLPMVEREIRKDAVYDYFFYQYIPDPKTIFHNIYKLEPGHTLSVSAKGMSKKKYWHLSFKEKRQSSPEQIASDLLAVINDNVRERMISDVPLGAFLSGGVDSSGVTALMAQNSSDPVTTCAIGFDSEKFDEVKYAKQIATQFATNHHEFTVRENVTENLAKIAAYFDEPFADPSLVPTYFVSQLARQKVTVALAGDGGDESFAGYSKYVTDQIENRLRNTIPGVVRKCFFPAVASVLRCLPGSIPKKACSLLNTLQHDAGYGFFLSNSFFSDRLWGQVAREDIKEEMKAYHPSEITLQYYAEADADNHLDKILYTDIKTYLPGDILVKVDRMSMAHSLEVRAPLLDSTVVEMAAEIPPDLKLNGKDKKHILKKAFSKFLSNEILYRKKMGFSVPLAEWFRNEIKVFAHASIFSGKEGLQNYFKMGEIKKLWDLHQAGKGDYSTELWSMLMFQLWFDRYAKA